MNDLGKFLTSQEIIIVYIIAAFACLICFIVYLIEKNNENLRKKHNTKELNKLVEEIRETLPNHSSDTELYEVPVLEPIVEEVSVPTEPLTIDSIDVEETVDLSEVVEQVQQMENEVEELQYTSIEPDQETARLELKKLQEQLEKEEALSNEVVNTYEEEQEQSAIISMDELLAKGREMYAANEITQYEDEGNEPISIQDLELQVHRQAATYDEPFIIANVVPEDELQAGINEAFEQIGVKEVLHMDDFNTIQPETVNPVAQQPEVKKFQCSPIISPIFGIERDPARDNAIALENTANYEKLDEALRANNEFYVTMNELQGKIE